jgi:hypothetical protein
MYAKVITSFEGVIQALSVKERPRAERSKQKVVCSTRIGQ